MNSNAINQLLQMFKKYYYQKLTQFKQYYSKISMMHLYQKNEIKKAIPFVDVESFYSNRELIPREQILDKWDKNKILNYFFQDKKIEENKDLIDIFSFSIIHHFFHFLLTKIQ